MIHIINEINKITINKTATIRQAILINSYKLYIIPYLKRKGISFLTRNDITISSKIAITLLRVNVSDDIKSLNNKKEKINNITVSNK